MGLANRAPGSRRTRTITVDGEKVKITSRMQTRNANFQGWKVNINGTEFFKFILIRKEAEESALKDWIGLLDKGDKDVTA